jgi:hypothetical protein
MTGKQKAAIGVGAAIAALWLYRSKLSGGGPVPSVTTSEGFDLSPYGGQVVYPPALVDLGKAIARAEGFYQAGSIPQRAHNPGDLKVPGWTGPTLGEGISVFDSDAAGFEALNRQLYLILTGQSGVYNLDMTIATMAQKWTGNDNADSWARNVAGFVGADPSAPLWSVLS